MCIEDVRMGRKTVSFMAIVSIPAGGVRQVLPADPFRYSLTLSAPSSGSLTFSINQNPGDGEGIVFHQGSGPVTLTIQNDGDLVRRAWYAYSVNAVSVALPTSQLRME